MDTTVPPAPETSETTQEPAAVAPAPSAVSLDQSVAKPHEEWAKAKGHTVTVERKNRKGKVLSVVVRPDWRLAAMRAYHKLEAGQAMTEAEYDQRLAKVLAEPIGHHVRPTKWAPRQKPVKPGKQSKAIRLRSSQRTR